MAPVLKTGERKLSWVRILYPPPTFAGARFGGHSPQIFMKSKKVIVNDLMQRGYVYELSEPMGKNFAADFKPELTPKQMLELGVFGGKYMTDCGEEFPRDWFEKAKLCSEKHDPEAYDSRRI